MNTTLNLYIVFSLLAVTVFISAFLTYTEHARRYLLEEGINAEMVIKTGSPMKEVLSYYKSAIDESNILTDIKLEPKGFFIVSAHREENIDDPENFDDLINMLNASLSLIY